MGVLRSNQRHNVSEAPTVVKKKGEQERSNFGQLGVSLSEPLDLLTFQTLAQSQIQVPTPKFKYVREEFSAPERSSTLSPPSEGGRELLGRRVPHEHSPQPISKLRSSVRTMSAMQK